jgi:hypothetical protein
MRARRRRFGVVALAVAAVAAVASVGWAAIGDDGTVKTCISKQVNWRPIDAGSNCKQGETTLDLYTKAGAEAAFLGKTEKASDADMLDGHDSTQFARVAWAGEISIASGLTVEAGRCTDAFAGTAVDFNTPNARFIVVVTPRVTSGPENVLTFTGMIANNFPGAVVIRMCNPSDTAVELTTQRNVELAVLRVN